MHIRVLGCSGAIGKDCRTTSFLVDDDLLVDAGTGVGDLTLDELRRIDHVLLTHSHLDHIAALPLMLDAVAGERSQALTVHALAPTIQALKAHVFNHLIWPDFSVIPSPEAPFVRFQAIEVGQQLSVAGKSVEVLPAVHTVPAVGYAITGERGQWVFSGDTERNPLFWQRVNQLPVAMLVIETAFSQREAVLAKRALHLAPQTLAEELAQIRYRPEGRYPIYITHTKPAETEAIFAEVEALDLAHRHDLHWLTVGQVFQL
ncbi:3',5'-cyclic-nucleotide phosphodiesterase [Hydrogenophaga sp. OTU3427]|uniref:3',5'-cyclic-nucleotide phosphodiesterase n=1 Tax=Hydrogenophaga sp. OTU3427 TaxID=3043856 RepID=UPI00313B11F9